MLLLRSVFSRPEQACKVPRQRAKINARITRQLDGLHDKISGNLRGVDGFEAQVEEIERSVTNRLVALQLTCA